MSVRIPKSPGSTPLAALAALCLCLVPAFAQSKPPESTSKVKKVLLYNKVGGWVSTQGIAQVQSVFEKLAASKGFELVQTSDHSVLTLDYLKQFQAIVWNNNTDGAKSVPSDAARQAVIDYLEQGGGWFLICLAGDHVDSWPALADKLGTKFIRHARTDRAEVVLDAAATAHKELKWMVDGFPKVIELRDLFLSFSNTVRPLPGVTVVATARGIPGIDNVVSPVGDGSGDNVYLWARQVGKGRLFYNASGFGNTGTMAQQEGIMAQQDSIVPKMYWENLRYVAGDYQNGCARPSNPSFDPDVRVHNEIMCMAVDPMAVLAGSDFKASREGLQLKLAHPMSGPFTVRVRDIRGVKIWERHLPAGTGEIHLDGALGTGICHVEIRGATGTFQRRLFLP